MAVSKIVKINIVSLQSHEEKVVDFLHKSGMVQIIEKTQFDEELVGEEEKVDFERKALEVEYVLTILEKYKGKEKQKLVERVSSGGKLRVSLKEYQKVVSDFKYQKAVEDIKDLSSKMQDLEEKNQSLVEEKELLKKWLKLDFNLSAARESNKGKIVFGVIKENLEAEFRKKIEMEVKEVEALEVSREDGEVGLLVTVSKEKAEKFEQISFEFDFEEVELPETGGSPKQKTSQIKSEILENKKEIKKIEKLLVGIAKKDHKNLKVIYDYLFWQKEASEAKGNFDLTKKAFSISAWIQKIDIPVLKKGLKSVTSDFMVEESEALKGEKSPVLIQNSSFVKPFETVTRIYGLPKRSEVDPTPYLAPFFIVYFALCLTDAGYGILLAVGTFLAIKVFKIPKEKQRLLKLLMYGGIVTFIIGALFGGWFGIESDKLPGFLKSIQVINPLEDVMVVLGIAAILGFIQILTGISIKLYWSVKNKMYDKDVMMDGFWFTILLMGALYILFSMVIDSKILSQISLYILLAVAFLVVWFSGTNLFKKKVDVIKEKEGKSSQYYTWLVLGNIIGLPVRLVSGILGLYTVVGYVSDVLSYSRLLALGLATGIIAMAINIIATLVGEMVPGVGFILMILVLIGGHTFNIAINVLGAYIHSGRLQFVEFFPKFIEGGGEAFMPFKREGKYIEITS